MNKYSADIIYTLVGPPLRNHVIVTDSEGSIVRIDKKDQHPDREINHFHGAICPGFINAHCHLELSHLKGKIETGTGLLNFIEKVVKNRNHSQDQIISAIEAADEEMYNNGIVAVGDISNTLDTQSTKDKSNLFYYTFVEMFDFMQDHLTLKTIETYQKVFENQSDMNNNKKSLVPHAPYTVGKKIFEYLNRVNDDLATISIHNQETQAENSLFLENKGDFLNFFKNFNFDMSFFQPIGKTSIHYAMENLNRKNKVLFVHNTMSSANDIQAAMRWNKQVFWVTCPNANLYIENRLPDYKAFIEQHATMTIGTDSLSSNWQLSVWEEIKTILRYNSYIPLETALIWGCKNGAEALGYEDTLGTIEIGKKPGLVHLDFKVTDGVPDISKSICKRII